MNRRRRRRPPPADGPSVDAVYARLRRDILSGTLTAGAELAQTRLAEELGVSRTPLREALRMLLRDGLVEGEPHRSLRVSGISPADMDQHWASRIALETVAVRAAVPHLTMQDFAAFEGDLAQMDYLGQRADFEAWNTVHQAFHHRVVKPAGAGLARTLAELTDRGSRYVRMEAYLREEGLWSLNAGEHRSMVDACADAAAAVCAGHVATTAYAVLAIVDPAFRPRLLPIAVELAQTPVAGCR